MSDSIFFSIALAITIIYLLIILFYRPKSNKR